MYDVHCHILPAVDDGAPDLDTALAMAEVLASVGFHTIAPSPHFGEGPGGDVSSHLASQARQTLAAALAAKNIALTLLPNAEHHITPLLFERIEASNFIPVGGAGRWLLVELPWQGLAGLGEVLFRLQAKGFKLLLAHPERYQFLEPDAAGQLVHRGVCMQLELGSFVGVYGQRAERRARALMKNGWAHVLASDLHRPKGAHRWLLQAMDWLAEHYGSETVQRGLVDNPALMLADKPTHSLLPLGAK